MLLKDVDPIQSSFLPQFPPWSVVAGWALSGSDLICKGGLYERLPFGHGRCLECKCCLSSKALEARLFEAVYEEEEEKEKEEPTVTLHVAARSASMEGRPSYQTLPESGCLLQPFGMHIQPLASPDYFGRAASGMCSGFFPKRPSDGGVGFAHLAKLSSVWVLQWRKRGVLGSV